MPTPPPPITSRTNARVKALRSAFTGKASEPGDLVGIEGYTAVKEASRSRLRLDTLFVAETAAHDLLTDDFLSLLRPREVLVLSREVFDSVVDTVSPQEVGATVEIPRHPVVGIGEGTQISLVLEDIQDPGNLGTLIRSAEAFGVDEVFLTPGCANAWNAKAVRASAGSVFRQPIRRMPITDCLRMFRERGIAIAGAVVERAGATLSPLARLHPPAALLIGNEGSGLSEGALSFVSEKINIPCRIESLNAAVAGSLLLYEAQRQNLFRLAAAGPSVGPSAVSSAEAG